MKILHKFTPLFALASSPFILTGLLLMPGEAVADTVVGCVASVGTNCPSPADSISDLEPPVVSTLTVPVGSCVDGSITDVDVSLDINHTWVGDLDAKLVSPGGVSTNILLDRPGVPTSTFGCSGNNIQSTFDDASGTPAETMCNGGPAISGTVSPFTVLSVFNGGNADGIWTLTITDNVGGDVGELNDWSLDIKCSAVQVQPTDVPIFSLWGLLSLMGLLGFGGRFMTRRKK